VTAFREIRGVRQRDSGELRRWFQSPYFDLFTVQDADGRVRWFQLCYARDSWRERVLEWRRGRGFQHHRVRDAANPVRKDSGALVPDGNLPFLEVSGKFQASGGLAGDIGRFVAEKLRDYARPPRRFRPPQARTPRWLVRLRFLDRAKSDR
jgi:hypothetical protein